MGYKEGFAVALNETICIKEVNIIATLVEIEDRVDIVSTSSRMDSFG